MIAALIWIGCVFLCAMNAKKKNRSVVGWVVLGFLFGIFALIVLLFLDEIPKNEPITSNRNYGSPTYVNATTNQQPNVGVYFCGNCGNKLPAGTRFCTRCGQPLNK